MMGAMIGDIVGSVYEWQGIKTKDFPLFREDCYFTDDTVMTCAVAEAIMMEIYDRFLKHLYEIDAKLVEEKEKAVENLNKELEKLQELEKAVKVLEKHKEKSKEAYIEEEKKVLLNGIFMNELNLEENIPRIDEKCLYYYETANNGRDRLHILWPYNSNFIYIIDENF